MPIGTARQVTYPTWWENTQRTTQDEWVTLATIPVPAGFTTALRIVVVARCTDLYVNEGLTAFGEGGWVDTDGVATPMGSTLNKYTNAYNWDVRFNQSGGNILVEVAGDPYVNVSWYIRYAIDQIEEV